MSFCCVYSPLASLSLCPNLFFSWGHSTTQIKLEHIPRASFNLITALKALLPNVNTFWGTGGYSFSIQFGGEYNSSYNTSLMLLLLWWYGNPGNFLYPKLWGDYFPIPLSTKVQDIQFFFFWGSGMSGVADAVLPCPNSWGLSSTLFSGWLQLSILDEGSPYCRKPFFLVRLTSWTCWRINKSWELFSNNDRKIEYCSFFGPDNSSG